MSSFLERQKLRAIRSIMGGLVTPENVDMLLEKVHELIGSVELLPGEALVTVEFISYGGQNNFIVQTKSEDMRPMRIIHKIPAKKLLLQADTFLQQALTEKQDGNRD